MQKHILILLSFFILFALYNTNSIELDSNLKDNQIFLKDPIMAIEVINIDKLNQPSIKVKNELELSILNNKSKHGFWESVIAGFTIIYASEIGDKTFLLCLIFSIKYGPYKIFILTSVLMVLGNAFWMIIGASVQMLLSEYVINWIAIALFFTFAVIMLLDGLKMDDSLIINEMHELEEEIERKESRLDNNHQELTTELINKDETELLTTNTNSNPNEKEEKKVKATVQKHQVESMVSILCGYGFTLIFAECGDVSQITAIAIAALYNFKGVLIGASLAHIGAALTSVCCGQLIAKHVSEKTVTLFGSGLFFFFGILFFASNVGLISINL